MTFADFALLIAGTAFLGAHVVQANRFGWKGAEACFWITLISFAVYVVVR